MQYMWAILVLGGLLTTAATLALLARALLLPVRTCTIDINDGRRAVEARGDQSLLEALYNEEVFIPSACGGQGTCGLCKIKVVAGAGPPLPTETPYLTPAEIAAGVRLACRLALRGDLRVMIDPDLLSIRRYRAAVRSARMLSGDTRLLSLELIEPETIAHRAGQYVQIEAPSPEGGLAPRAYSISSPAAHARAVEIMVKLVPGGVASTFLHRLGVGDTVWFTGPYGDFRLSDDPSQEIVLVAGGCGLAPARSILLTLLERWPLRPCRLFFGCRRPGNLLCRDELVQLAAEHANFKLILAAEAVGGREHFDGHVGLIHEALERHLPVGAGRIACVCGPEAMVQAVGEVLTSKGFSPEDIHHEAY